MKQQTVYCEYCNSSSKAKEIKNGSTSCDLLWYLLRLCTISLQGHWGRNTEDDERSVVQVLDAVMRYSDRTAGEADEHAGQQLEVLHWAAAIDDTGHPCLTMPSLA